MDFTPPKPKISGIYATYMPFRHPQFKSHTQLGHAKNALGGDGDMLSVGICYELKDGEWVELWRTELGQTKFDHPAYRERAIKEGIKIARRNIQHAKAGPGAEYYKRNNPGYVSRQQHKLQFLLDKAAEYGIKVKP